MKMLSLEVKDTLRLVHVISVFVKVKDSSEAEDEVRRL